MKDIVITGTGLVCSLGITAREVYKALLSGKNGARPLAGFDTTGFDCQVGHQIPALDPSRWGIHPREARIMGKHSFMLLYCAREAFKASCLDGKIISGEEIGMFVGMGSADYHPDDFLLSVLKSRDHDGNLAYETFFSKGYQEIYPLTPLSCLNNISVCQTAIHLNIRGENTIFSPHADAGCQAIAEGARTIMDRKAKAVLVGGVSETISPISLARGHFLKGMNTEGPVHKMACRPFSKNRKGTVLGEGGAMMVLESRASAVQRGIPFIACISGYGAACEGQEESGPTERAMAVAMAGAIAEAGIEPVHIDLIIAHGDGSPNGDEKEIAAIHHVFSPCIEKMPVFSSKGALGDLLSGSSAVDAVLAVEMIEKGSIPFTLHAAPLADGISFQVVHGKPMHKKVQRVLINSRSEEGSCASLIVEGCH